MAQPQDQLLTPADAARLLGITPAAVVAMAERGTLPAIRTAGGRRLFLRRDVEALASARAANPTRPEA
jgi:excisionase family DNA binding protein